MAMPRDAGGWAEYVTREAPPGTRYRYRIDGELLVPDPAARFQPGDVHGASEVVDPLAHAWTDTAWIGLPPERLVFYELHVGAFTPAGTYAGVAERLDHLVSLGVTAVELMPLADFPGRWGWGYDGVLLYAPEASYGRPEDLKALVDAAHARGLAVFLDVVYNHFGPEGNYLHRYAPGFFNPRHQTPWGDGVNYDGPGSEVVRAFMIHNALYWIEEYHLDGLRLDAVNAIADGVVPPPARRAGPRGGRRARPRAPRAPGAGERRQRGALPRGRGGAAGAPLYQAQWNDDRAPRAARAPHRRARRLLRRLPAAAAASRALPHRGLRVPGRARPRTGTARAASRARTCPRPPSWASSRITTRSAIAPSASAITALASRRRGARGHRGAAALARAAAAVHGRGVGRARALPVLQRSGPGAGPARLRGPAARVRALSRVRRSRDARAHPRSPGPGHLRALGPRLESRAAPPSTRTGSRSTRRCSRCGLEAIAPLLADEPVAGQLVEGARRHRARGRVGVPGGHPAARRQPGRGGRPARGAGRGLGPAALRARVAVAPTWSTLPPWSVAVYLAGARP